MDHSETTPAAFSVDIEAASPNGVFNDILSKSGFSGLSAYSCNREAIPYGRF
jgi:hypothetical protein